MQAQKLRPYQQLGLDAVQTNYTQGVTRQLVAMPTGSGKTILFAHIPTLAGLPAGQTIVIAHREELLTQAAEKIAHWNPTLSVSIEQAEKFADPTADIIIGSVATLGRKVSKRRERFDWGNIKICIVDEAHHVCASTYKTLLDEAGFLSDNPEKLLVGVTATPNRADGMPLAEVFQKIVYHYSLRQAITDKWLCDLVGIRVDTRSNLDQVRTTAGELNLKDLSEVVNVPERNKLITQAWRENASDRQTIVFCVDIQHSVDMAAMFQAQGIRADAVWGDDPQRAEKLRQHNAGEIQILCNCGVLTEGYDSPIVAAIVLARPTKSSLLYEQMIGRGTRLFEGKVNCLVIDCMDQSRRHRLASLPSLLGIPAQMDLRNQSAIAALKTLEDAARQYPHIDLSGLRDIAKLEEYIENINLFEVKFDDVVVEHSQLNWFKAMDGDYVLSLAQGETASIRQNILGKFDVSIIVNGQNYSGERETLQSAFKSADATIAEHGSNIIGMVSRDQRWHKDGATSKQLTLLGKLYKGKAVPANLTKGAAAKLISQFFVTAGPRPARPMWLQAKIDREKKRA